MVDGPHVILSRRKGSRTIRVLGPFPNQQTAVDFSVNTFHNEDHYVAPIEAPEAHAFDAIESVRARVNGIAASFE